MSRYVNDEDREYYESSRGRKQESIARNIDYNSLSLSPAKSQSFYKSRRIVRGLDSKHLGDIESQTTKLFNSTFRDFEPFHVTLNFARFQAFDAELKEEEANSNKRSNQKRRNNDNNSHQQKLNVVITVPTRMLFEIEMLLDEQKILLIEYWADTDKPGEKLYGKDYGSDAVLNYPTAKHEKRIDAERVKVFLELSH
jgi:hypothetical protein